VVFPEKAPRADPAGHEVQLLAPPAVQFPHCELHGVQTEALVSKKYPPTHERKAVAFEHVAHGELQAEQSEAFEKNPEAHVVHPGVPEVEQTEQFNEAEVTQVFPVWKQ